MTTGYPVHLDLAGRRVVVVGGGPVAARRMRDLVDAGADVHVVAAYACEDVHEAAARGDAVLHLREFECRDLDDAWLVHTATGDEEVDDSVVAAASERRVWCVRASDAARSPAWRPAVARSGDVVVSVSAGGDPRRATALRSAIAADLQTGRLPLRRHRRRPGRVTLVGGGPGDPGLITTRGRRRLAEADVVVVDRLAPRELLAELADDVEIVEAGKAPGDHLMRQEEINAVLVDRAGRGLHVVRLKGGDPLVLGRGSEEAEACRAAGVPVELVPGVSSALAVPAAAGIPVTARGVASRFAVVSAHDEALDVEALASLDGTLVFLRGVGRLAEIAERLVAHGRPGSEPVAVVERGTRPDQRVTRGTLETIARRAREREVTNPAVIVVGAVAALEVTR
ncbi:uroporphyrinogen-III C-methyltransferase [Nocardioides sp.]|uniref:uroporphyrinogen-III C-methyltransferase n=1 Tax=Nocardioides sp. TaxID=35761 RepID=UPI00352834D9